MDEVFSLKQILEDRRAGDADAFLRFLHHEGLELLAAYRAIGNEDVRASLLHLVQKIASRKADGGDGPAAA